MRTSTKTRRGRLLTVLAGISAAFLLQAAPAPASPAFDFLSLDATTRDAAGQAVTQAGAHAFGGTVRMTFTNDGASTEPEPTEVAKDLDVELPPGLVGNTQVVPKCSPAAFADSFGVCPPGSQVGLAANDAVGLGTYPVYNLEPEDGTAAQFGFKIVGIPTIFTARVRPVDYGVTISTTDLTSVAPFTFTSVELWGVPADPIHDRFRDPYPGWLCLGDLTDPAFNEEPPCASSHAAAGVAPRPFVSNPTNCAAGPLTTQVSIATWNDPGDVHRADVLSHDSAEPPNPTGVTGCDQLEFDPRVEARATTPLGDSPSGIDVSIHIPQNEDPEGLATAHMKKVVTDLPKGMSVNPSSANGLGACSPQQMGMTTAVGNPAARFNGAPATCPDSSRLGTVEAISPAVDHPLLGSIFLAEQNNNPFNSTLALYLVIDDPRTGIGIKLAGKVDPDPVTGQVRTTFDENPQLPVENFKFNFFTGPRAALKTPLACGTYTSTSILTPWSTPEGADAKKQDSFAITQGAGGGACVKSEAAAPNTPSFSAGTIDPTAGIYSPFVMKLSRADGTQQLKGLDATLPKGLLGKLAGIPYCSDSALAAAAGKRGKAEQASASCPSASEVGTVNVGSGAGSTPVYVGGKAYLSGPYKGAPLSLAIVTPVVTGPLDLGTVVVRTALNIDPVSAQIHAVSDEFPTIIEGIPLDIRSLSIRLERPNFTLNPTSCERTAVLGGAVSVFNQTASLTSPFQVGGCGALGFKPKLALHLSGATKRGRYPALKAVLTARPGDANIAKALVTLPHSEFLAQNHIKTICTRVQFAASACPPGSIYGKVKATSPLIDGALQGPVYLRSSSNKLPDLVADLNGQIRITLAGRIDSVKGGGIRNSFEVVPDAPVSKFTLEMEGGKKGLLENSRNLCNSVNKADVKLDAQNGKFYDTTPVVTNDCKVKKKHKKVKRNGNSKRGSRN